VARWTVKEIAAIPAVADVGPDDPVWYPLQHALGIETFGANLFVASHPEQKLVEEHDERASGQQELYVVLEGAAVFELDGEQIQADRGTAVAVTDPSWSTWNPAHFKEIPSPELGRSRLGHRCWNDTRPAASDLEENQYTGTREDEPGG